MSNRQRLRLSFNMDDPTHAIVWDEIQSHTGKQRSEFVIACVSKATERQSLLDDISRLLDEKLARILTQSDKACETKPPMVELPQSLLDFADDF